MSRRIESVTTIGNGYAVALPVAVRREAGIEVGDEIRWSIDEDGSLSVEVIEQRHGPFSELEPIDVGEGTHAAEDHDSV